MAQEYLVGAAMSIVNLLHARLGSVLDRRTDGLPFDQRNFSLAPGLLRSQRDIGLNKNAEQDHGIRLYR